MKIVVLDGGQLNPGDLSWEQIEACGQVEIYKDTAADQIIQRSSEADLVITNKAEFDRETIESLPHLKCIIVSATGYNIIDVDAAAENDVVVCNAPNYSTESVAQHVFAMIFAIYNKVETYSNEVKKNKWADMNDWSYTNEPLTNVQGKTLGIYGFGQIGRRVGELGKAFGMKIIAVHKHPERDAMSGVSFVDVETLFTESDLLTLHVPLNEKTRHIVNAKHLALMKEESILINTGRGALVDEEALANTLSAGKIRAAALDVMVAEPPQRNHPLFQYENCYITPHIAWAGVNARQQLMDIIVQNIKAFQQGNPINKVS